MLGLLQPWGQPLEVQGENPGFGARWHKTWQNADYRERITCVIDLELFGIPPFITVVSYVCIVEGKGRIIDVPRGTGQTYCRRR